MKKYSHVAVLMGGVSAERDVSLNSGSAVAQGLRDAGYSVSEVDVAGRDFSVPPAVEAVFVALHGTFGEDGGVQTRLQELGLPYTGSGADASRIAFDKFLTEAVLKECGIPVPESEVLQAWSERTLPLPVAVKPPREGSSVGCHLIFEESQWCDAFQEALTHDAEVMVQRFIPGREFTVGIVDGEVLPVVEIIPAGEWYDYTSKYEADNTQYDIPAVLEDCKRNEMQQVALETYRVLNARGMGRVDIRMTPEGELYVLELNSIPGFTSHSLLPKAAAAAGIDFPSLCSRIMETASL